MGIGPFSTYAPPGTYTKTTVELSTGSNLIGLRVPVLIGTGREALSLSDFEMIRGSSSQADTPVFHEDVTGRWVVSGSNTNPTLGDQTGALVRFKVRNTPIVDGTGAGKVTYDASKISVLVDNQISHSDISVLDKLHNS